MSLEHDTRSDGVISFRFLEAAGKAVRKHGTDIIHAAAVVGTAVSFIPRRNLWRKDNRNRLARQLMVIGVEPLLFVCGLAALVGVSVVVQVSHWTAQAGQTQLLGPMLIAIIARELAPVLINFVVIVRSGSAMAAELGVMKLGGEIEKLESGGGDAFLDLVVPRVLGMALSTFCLTFVFTLAALASGFLCAALLGKGSGDLLLFADSISRAIQAEHILNILAKSILPALFAAASCCIGGLAVSGAVKAIPNATQRALTRSIAGLFIISSAISFLAYL